MDREPGRFIAAYVALSAVAAQRDDRLWSGTP
jgi:hypothetical protein